MNLKMPMGDTMSNTLYQALFEGILQTFLFSLQHSLTGYHSFLHLQGRKQRGYLSAQGERGGQGRDWTLAAPQ